METLEIRNLSLRHALTGRMILEDVSLRVGDAEIVCLAGRSGAGKSLTAAAVMGLLPAGVEVAGGEIAFAGETLPYHNADGMRSIRGRRIGMVFQEPLSCLNPVRRCGVQLADVLRFHGVRGHREIGGRVVQALRDVGFDDAERIARAFPHELSGGQRQRVMLAAAILWRPALLIADEPTTALDSAVAQDILALIDSLRRRLGMSVLLITHDLDAAARVSDRLIMLSDGRIADGDAFPEGVSGRDLVGNPGMEAKPAPGDEVVSALGVSLRFAANLGLALEDVTVSVRAGEIVGVIGETGAGKTTLSRCLAGLVKPTAGAVLAEGKDVTARLGSRRGLGHLTQIVYQDPVASLDPGMRAGETIRESLTKEAGGGLSPRERVVALLEAVDLPAAYYDRYPHELSGGEKQRVAIARALAPEPKLLLADEPISALDAPVQAQIMDLFKRLCRERRLAIMLVSHDLAQVVRTADRVVVVADGKVVWQGETAALHDQRDHAPTVRMLEAAGLRWSDGAPSDGQVGGEA